MKILVLGAGGHGQVVADIFRARAAAGDAVECLGFLDDTTIQPQAGWPVLGRLGLWSDIPHDGLIVAIGDNAARRRIFADLAAHGACFAVARHPATTLAVDVQVGAGAMLCAGVVINTQAVIGRNTIINTSTSVDHHCTIGDHVHLAPGVHLGGNVHVGDGAMVGIGATVLPGRTIGPWATVGAGAVVVDDVPEGALVVGVPAKPRTRT